MAQMSEYCKAYYIKQLRQFPKWNEDVANLRTRKETVDGKELEQRATSLGEDDIVYLHQNYVVAHDVFYDENVIFGNVTDEWKDFCHKVLEFKVPVRNTAPAAA